MYCVVRMGILRFVLSFFVVILFGTSTYGHSYVTYPYTRSNQTYTTTGAYPGPCDIVSYGSPSPATATQRGAQVTIMWPRNNHPGGFIRWAWAQTAMSGITNLNTQIEFDSMVDKFECFEKGGPTCSPSTADPNGADATGATQKGCTTIYTVPTFLADGSWTLQWLWFGGGFTLPDYHSCIDFTVSGGAAVTSQPGTPTFVGGDYAYPSQQVCKFFNNDAPGNAPSEPCPGCNGSQLFGAPSVNFVIGTAASAAPGATTVACTVDSDCASGVCLVSGFCMAKSSGLSAGGIAAIVFAMLFVVIVVIGVLFVFINKGEISNWKPFKK